MAHPSVPAWLFAAALFAFIGVRVHAQPSPDVQKRIAAAIAAAGNGSGIDYTAFVNPFIGTGMSVPSETSDWM